MSTIIILSGFYLLNWKQSFWKPRYILLIIFYCFIFLIRRFKIAFIKVQKSYFDKKLQTHVSNEKKGKKNKFIKKNKSNFLILILKFFHFMGDQDIQT